MSGALSAGEIAGIQTDLEQNLMPDTATIFAKGKTDDGQGGRLEAGLQPRQADVPCGFGPMKAKGDSEAVVGDRPSAEGRWLFRMPAGTDVRPTDVIVVDGDDRHFEVGTLRSSRGAWSFLTRFEAITIDVGGAVGE